jgi:hypothetical protein
VIDLPSGDTAEDAPVDASPMPDDAEIALHVERARFLSDALVEARQQAGRAAVDLEVARAETDTIRAAFDRYRARRSVRIARRVTSVVRRLTGRGAARGGAGSRTAAAARPAPGPAATATAPTIDRPAAFRADLLAKIDGRPGSPSLRVGVAGGGLADDRDVGAALAAHGWEVVEGTTSGLDVLLAIDSAVDIQPYADGPIIVAWIDGDAGPWLDRAWFDGYDLVLTTARSTADAIASRSVHQPVVAAADEIDGHAGTTVAALLERALRTWVAATRVDLDIGTPGWSEAERWGDYHFARAAQRAFQRRGIPTRVRFRHDWNTEAAGTADVVLHLFGYKERVTRPDQLNALWIISHPAMVTDRHLGRQDIVFVASDRFADHLRTRTEKPVHVLHQATDADRFRPTPGGPEHQLLVVAGHRAERRPTVDELTPTLRDFAVYGHGWTPDVLDPRHHRGDHVPNDQLAAFYAAADIVLNDHWADMASWGFMANRLYDAAASGAFVLSDHLDEIAEEFDGGIATFGSGAELRALVTRYLAQPELRSVMAERARAAVLARHTFDHRVDTLLAAIGPMLDARRDGAAPGADTGPPADVATAAGTSR